VQSPVTAHSAQIAPLQPNEHVVGVAGVQVPAPLHARAPVACPDEHIAAAHITPVPGYVHAVRSVPLHVPPHVGPSDAHAARVVPCGAPVTAPHVPMVPARSQASHWPSHAVSQQNPSTQFPESHSDGIVQTEPFGIAFARAGKTNIASAAASTTHALRIIVRGIRTIMDVVHPFVLVGFRTQPSTQPIHTRYQSSRALCDDGLP
jgi:hypothetical protein